MAKIIGYSRCSSDAADHDTERSALAALRVRPNRLHIDTGLTGPPAPRPELRAALDSLSSGDTLVVTALERLGRSLSDAVEILGELNGKGVKLRVGTTLYDPATASGATLLQGFQLAAGFETSLIRLRTREGMKTARALGNLRGKQPKLTAKQEARMVRLHASGRRSTAELAEEFGVARSTVYRAIQRASTLE